QARALQPLEDGVGAGQGAEASIAQAVVAAFEDPQRVAGLGRFELRERPEFRQPGFEFGLLGGGRWRGEKFLRLAVARVALAEEWAFEWEASVVIQRGAP